VSARPFVRWIAFSVAERGCGVSEPEGGRSDDSVPRFRPTMPLGRRGRFAGGPMQRPCVACCARRENQVTWAAPFSACLHSITARRNRTTSPVQLVQRDRQVSDARPGRVIDRVGDRRRDADDADLADALEARSAGGERHYASTDMRAGLSR
jgi:hypothetical protein